MPGPIQTGDELGDGAITLDEKMCGDLQPGDLFEERMLVALQAVLKELLNPAGTELAWRQADVVDHQQGNLAGRALIEVRRGAVAYAMAPAGGGIQVHRGKAHAEGRRAG